MCDKSHSHEFGRYSLGNLGQQGFSSNVKIITQLMILNSKRIMLLNPNKMGNEY